MATSRFAKILTCLLLEVINMEFFSEALGCDFGVLVGVVGVSLRNVSLPCRHIKKLLSI